MSGQDIVIDLVLGVAIFLGGYQPYFYVQRKTAKRAKVYRGPLSSLDEMIPLWPIWIWPYTVFYYPVVVIVVVAASVSHAQFNTIAFSYMIMLGALALGFLLMPIVTPAHWREFDRDASIHSRFLAFTQDIDDANNCFPSGHAAIAVITAYHMIPWIGPYWAAAYALWIMLSCLFCKQHYIVDVIAGGAVGLGCISIYTRMMSLPFSWF